MIPFISFGVVLLRGQYHTRSNPYTGGENQTGKMERLGNVKVTWNGEVWEVVGSKRDNGDPHGLKIFEGLWDIQDRLDACADHVYWGFRQLCEIRTNIKSLFSTPMNAAKTTSRKNLNTRETSTIHCASYSG